MAHRCPDTWLLLLFACANRPWAQHAAEVDDRLEALEQAAAQVKRELKPFNGHAERQKPMSWQAKPEALTPPPVPGGPNHIMEDEAPPPFGNTIVVPAEWFDHKQGIDGKEQAFTPSRR